MHRINTRIYYEDTDAGGIVYYANYLKFAERARTEYVRALGLEQAKLAEEEDLLFVVRKANMELFKPARLDDLITVYTKVIELKDPKITMQQEIKRGDTLLATIDILLVTVNNALKPKKLSPQIKNTFLNNP